MPVSRHASSTATNFAAPGAVPVLEQVLRPDAVVPDRRQGIRLVTGTCPVFGRVHSPKRQFVR